MTLALGIAIGLLAALLLGIVFRRTSPAEAPAVAQLRNDVQSLRQSTENSIQNVAAAFSTAGIPLTSNAVPGGGQFTLQADHQPFWEIMRQLAQQAPITLPPDTVDRIVIRSSRPRSCSARRHPR